MNTANELMALVDDLAGRWTDRVLERFRAAGFRQVSIDMELETWRALKKAFYAQIVRQPKVRGAFKPPSRSDFTPRLRLSTAGV
jgi:hypothetical protein